MRIYRKSDRIRIKIKDVSFIVSPLNYAQKSEIAACIKLEGGIQVEDTIKSLFLMLKYSLKAVEGLETPDGKPYELEFDGDIVSDESIDDVLNLGMSELSIAAYQLLNGIPDKIIDPNTGKQLKGVSVKYEGNSLKK